MISKLFCQNMFNVEAIVSQASNHFLWQEKVKYRNFPTLITASVIIIRGGSFAPWKAEGLRSGAGPGLHLGSASFRNV